MKHATTIIVLIYFFFLGSIYLFLGLSGKRNVEMNKTISVENTTGPGGSDLKNIMIKMDN